MAAVVADYGTYVHIFALAEICSSYTLINYYITVGHVVLVGGAEVAGVFVRSVWLETVRSPGHHYWSSALYRLDRFVDCGAETDSIAHRDHNLALVVVFLDPLRIQFSVARLSLQVCAQQHTREQRQNDWLLQCLH